MASRVKLNKNQMISQYGDIELYKETDFHGNVFYRGDKVAKKKANAELIHVEVRDNYNGPDIAKIGDLITSGISEVVLIYKTENGDSVSFGYTREDNHPWNNYAEERNF